MRDGWVNGVRYNNDPVAAVDDTHVIFQDPRVALLRERRVTRTALTRFMRSNTSSRVVQIPFDVWFEIFTYLEPLDILQLARTCKDLRATLMHRSSTQLWRTTRLRAAPDSPQCPEWLSEPAYADLLFDHHCYRCYRDCRQVESLSTPAIWQFRARYCQRCRSEELVPPSAVFPSDMSIPEVMRSSPELFLCTCAGDGQKDLHGRSSNTYFYNSEIQNTLKSIADLAGNEFLDPEKIPAGLEDLLQGCAERTERIMKESAQLQAWNKVFYGRKAADAYRRKLNRGMDILERLRKLGWDSNFLDDHRTKYSLSRESLFTKKEELTDKVWNSIKDSLFVKLRCLKKTYDGDFRRKILSERLQLLHKSIPDLFGRIAAPHIRPRTIDLALVQEFRAILDQPNDIVLTAKSFEPVQPQLEAITRRWRANAKLELLKSIRTAQLTIGLVTKKEVDPFQLALTSFLCTACRQILPPNIVLQHRCTTLSLNTLTPSYRNFVRQATISDQWTADIFDWATCAQAAMPIIRACGLNPEVSQPKELDAADMRLSCCLCAVKGRSLLVMSWRTAIHHAIRAHAPDMKRLVWEPIPPDQAIRLRKLETTARTILKQRRAQAVRWACVRCPPHHLMYNLWGDSNMEATLSAHIKNDHDIKEPEKGWDYYVIPKPPVIMEAFLLLDDKISPSKLHKEEKDALERGMAGYLKRRYEPLAVGESSL